MHPSHSSRSRMMPELRQCIQNCLDSYQICLETLLYCLEKGGRYVEPPHTRLVIECSNICNLNANFMIMGSEYHSRTCELCFEICERCAESCERFTNDQQMKHCAEACRRSAKSCRHMMSGARGIPPGMQGAA